MMRSVFLLMLLGGMAVAQQAKPVPMPKLPPPEKAPIGSLSAAGQQLAAVLDLTTRVPARDQANTRYISLYAVPAEKVSAYRLLLQYVLNTVSQADALGFPTPVPDTGGRLFRVRLTQYRWTKDAFSAVARRDPYFREPSIPHRETEFGRQVIGVAQDVKTFASELVVEGTFFMRSALQPDGFNDTYYDLLYAEQRFATPAKAPVVEPALLPPDPGPAPSKPKERPWKGGVWPGDGKYYPVGAFPYTPYDELQVWEKAIAEWKKAKEERDNALAKVPQAPAPEPIKKNFPANVKEWEKHWGVEDAAKFEAERGFVLKRGEVAIGAKNVRGGKGSFVAFNDRVIAITRVPTGFHLETYDSLTTRKEQDFLENPLNVAKGKIKADAGELLVNLPNGLQAALLINGVGDRVEFADSRVARNTADARDVTVRTQIGCVQCHGVDGGFISPTSRKLRESIEAGLKLKVKNEEDEIKVRAFFLGWEKEEAEIRGRYTRAMIDVTRLDQLDAKDKGLTGAQLVAVMMDFRDWYDDPVTMDQAVGYFGEAAPTLFAVLSLSPTAGLNLIAVGKGMPRAAWDDTGANEVRLLLALMRSLPSLAFPFRSGG